jgi:hypothetical protein
MTADRRSGGTPSIAALSLAVHSRSRVLARRYLIQAHATVANVDKASSGPACVSR